MLKLESSFNLHLNNKDLKKMEVTQNMEVSKHHSPSSCSGKKYDMNTATNNKR